eukprot:s636_g32.t1
MTDLDLRVSQRNCTEVLADDLDLVEEIASLLKRLALHLGAMFGRAQLEWWAPFVREGGDPAKCDEEAFEMGPGHESAGIPDHPTWLPAFAALLMQEGNSFYLDGETPHRVLGRGAALTLYVRGTEKPYETIARAESATPDWQGVNQKESLLDATDAEKLRDDAVGMCPHLGESDSARTLGRQGSDAVRKRNQMEDLWLSVARMAPQPISSSVLSIRLRFSSDTEGCVLFHPLHEPRLVELGYGLLLGSWHQLCCVEEVLGARTSRSRGLWHRLCGSG